MSKDDKELVESLNRDEVTKQDFPIFDDGATFLVCSSCGRGEGAPHMTSCKPELRGKKFSRITNMDTAANIKQVGGDHYKVEGEQHWDRMWRLYREAWFVGNITKYVERYRSKNGIQDLEKARHYLDKLIELETDNASN